MRGLEEGQDEGRTSRDVRGGVVVGGSMTGQGLAVRGLPRGALSDPGDSDPLDQGNHLGSLAEV